MQVVFLSPNTTARIQLLDAGVIASLQLIYRAFHMDRTFDLVDVGAWSTCKVDLFKCIHALHRLSNVFTSFAINNRWAHTGILRTDSENSTLESKNCAVTAAENENHSVQVKKLVAPHSKMFFHVILNSPGEDGCVFALHDEELVGQESKRKKPESDDGKICTVCFHHYYLL